MKIDPEIRTIHDRIVMTIAFIENSEDFAEIGRQLREGADAALVRGDRRALRLLANDVDALTSALPPAQREGLEALLLARLGVDKESERVALRERVAAIIERGTIASEKERRRLQDYADTLEAIGGNEAELLRVRNLLSRA